MRTTHIVVALVLALLGCGAGTPRSTAARNADAPSASAVPAVAPQLNAPSPPAAHGAQSTAPPPGASHLEDVEERRGPFLLAGHDFTAVLRYKRWPGDSSPDGQALAAIEIRDAAGTVHYQESFPYTVERGGFAESCSADVRLLAGSTGSGLLIASACVPSTPLGGGPWRIVGLVGGKLVPVGKPLVTEGELGAFVPGAITRIGKLTQIRPDVLTVRTWTGYFFVSVPVRVDWHARQLALAQRCMYQTGQGIAEEGCEVPVEDTRRLPQEQELTFARVFRESNERSGPPAHVVVKKDSSVEVLAGKVLIQWEEGADAVNLSVGEDVWVKVRIDGQEGWIHTAEDLNAIGLFASG